MHAQLIDYFHFPSSDDGLVISNQEH